MTTATLDRIGVAGFFGALLALSLFDVVAFDLGFHLRAGEWIWQHGAIPTHDPFSYLAQGRRWIDSHWLYQLLLHAVYANAGTPGLVALRAGLVAALFALLLAACRERRALVLPIAALALGVAYQRFVLRPDLLSLVFLAAFVLGAERFARRPRFWLVALPLIQIAWVNAHGLHVLGPIYLALRTGGDALQGALHRFDARVAAPALAPGELRQRAGLCALCGAALLANANGIDGIVYPFALLGELRGAVDWFPGVGELASPFGVDVRSWFHPVVFHRLFVALSLVALIIGWRRFQLSDVLPYLAFLILSFAALRNLALFAVVALPIVVRGFATHLEADDSRVPGPRASLVAAAAMLILCATTWLAVTSDALYRDLGWQRRFGFGEHAVYPDAIVERLRAIDGRFLNDATGGGYLIWKLYPEKQVALDGRWEVYGELMPRLRAAFREPQAFEELVREHDIRAVVLLRRSKLSRATIDLLRRRRDFRRSIETPNALLYERSRH